jgi:hypothetical protein
MTPRKHTLTFPKTNNIIMEKSDKLVNLCRMTQFKTPTSYFDKLVYDAEELGPKPSLQLDL